MAILRRIIQSLWWLALAYVPLALSERVERLYAELGCPPHGDCYVAGTMTAFDLELLTIAIALLVWPACLWFLGLGWMAGRLLGLATSFANRFKAKRLRRPG